MNRFYIGETRAPGEGLRIGAVRYPPRGIKKENYASENCFDIWLPVLAPSRRLMASRKKRDDWDVKFWHRFFASYEREMRHNTDARQTIEMLAKLSRRTRISVGCHCGEGTWCHVTVLLRLLEEARANPDVGLGRDVRVCKPGRGALYHQSVYTAVHPDKVTAIAGKRGSHRLERGQEWVTGEKLLQESVLVDQQVPILFGNASQIGPVTHWALLECTDEDRKGPCYWVRNVRALRGRKLQELVLVSEGRRLSKNYQRAYAICETPGFLKG
jgi:uncharacterized protein YeaO (DUF488 family)